MTEEIVGGRMFKEIKSDERVTPDLDYCLYCKVSQSGQGERGTWHKNIDYRIPLNCVNGASVKQCPACKTVYILRNPTE